MAAFFWETPPFSADTSAHVPFEFVAIEAPGTPFPDRVLRSGGQYWTISVGARWTFGRVGGRLAQAEDLGAAPTP